MQEKFFSIIVVALNPGKKLKKTLDSIVSQSFTNYEVIIKDGGSKDGSLETLEKEGFFDTRPSFRIVRQGDKSIYDGMNQAVKLAHGRFVQFLNCGDLFYNSKVLEMTAEQILLREQYEGRKLRIFYGNQYNQLQDSIVYSSPQINDFTCYRNVPCHQVCFYDTALFQERAYDLRYRVRADYEHFLYSIYDRKAEGVWIPVVVASYEGGGFSETQENRKRSAGEHKEITVQYLGRKKVWKYGMIMALTLAPVRTKMAESPTLSKLYNGIKNAVYGRK